MGYLRFSTLPSIYVFYSIENCGLPGPVAVNPATHSRILMSCGYIEQTINSCLFFYIRCTQAYLFCHPRYSGVFSLEALGSTSNS